jgi:ubiquinone/menaquinone biosynthesis C-methylase UbiE
VGIYTEWVVPHLVHLSMRQSTFVPYRQRVVSQAQGRVLEIGIGSGLNLPLYTSAVTSFIGLDPSPKLLSMAKQKGNESAIAERELVEASAESIPLEDGSVDTVVSTWTLCTIPDVQGALKEMNRVMRPTGRLLFVEHGRSPETRVRRWQDRLNPIWRPIAGGCNLNRPIVELLEQAGFRIEHVDTGYGKGPRPMTFMYEGVARKTTSL